MSAEAVELPSFARSFQHGVKDEKWGGMMYLCVRVLDDSVCLVVHEGVFANVVRHNLLGYVRKDLQVLI